MSIAAFVARRAIWTVPLILGVMLATFALMHAAKGDPFRPPEGYVSLPTSLQDDMRRYYHLDDAWYVQFGGYVKNVFTLNFGPSLTNRHRSVDDVIRGNLPVTGELVLLASAWSLVVGIALGLVSALRRHTAADYLGTAVATVLLVVPIFFVAYELSFYLVRTWHVFPPGWQGWESKLLPVLVLGLAPAGYVARLVRGAVVETLGEDYVRTARAKGLRRERIVIAHVLRNSLVPLLSAATPMLALLITGAFFVELYFGVPGAAVEYLAAARTRDYPMIMGLTVALATIVLVANLVADILVALLDPRLRAERA